MLSVIIPAYNESLTITRAAEVIDSLLDENKIEHELLFVDDGSKDGTMKVVKEMAAQDERVKYISFSRNFGKEAVSAHIHTVAFIIYGFGNTTKTIAFFKYDYFNVF